MNWSYYYLEHYDENKYSTVLPPDDKVKIYIGEDGQGRIERTV